MFHPLVFTHDQTVDPDALIKTVVHSVIMPDTGSYPRYFVTDPERVLSVAGSQEMLRLTVIVDLTPLIAGASFLTLNEFVEWFLSDDDHPDSVKEVFWAARLVGNEHQLSMSQGHAAIQLRNVVKAYLTQEWGDYTYVEFNKAQHRNLPGCFMITLSNERG